MNCLDYFRITRSTKGQNSFEEVSPFTANDILEKNVESLDGDEKLIFNWMLLYYSDAWIAESLMLSRRQMKEFTNTILNKLKVRSKTSLLRVYGYLSKKEDVPNASEIDRYVDERIETEIRKQLES